VPIADTGGLRADLTAFAAALADSLERLRLAGNSIGGPSAGLAAELTAAAARHPDIGELVRAGFATRHGLAPARLRRPATPRGCATTSTPKCSSTRWPVWYRVLVAGLPASRNYAERLVTAVLDGAFSTTE